MNVKIVLKVIFLGKFSEKIFENFEFFLDIFENDERETKQIEIYKDTRREFERYACCNDRECIYDISNECPKNYFRPRGETEKCCHELTIYKNGECLPKYQSEPLVPPTVTRAVSTRTVPPTTTEKPRPKCKGNCSFWWQNFCRQNISSPIYFVATFETFLG